MCARKKALPINFAKETSLLRFSLDPESLAIETLPSPWAKIIHVTPPSLPVAKALKAATDEKAGGCASEGIGSRRESRSTLLIRLRTLILTAFSCGPKGWVMEGRCQQNFVFREENGTFYQSLLEGVKQMEPPRPPTEKKRRGTRDLFRQRFDRKGLSFFFRGRQEGERKQRNLVSVEKRNSPAKLPRVPFHILAIEELSSLRRDR